jgi:hypothetical protein
MLSLNIENKSNMSRLNEESKALSDDLITHVTKTITILQNIILHWHLNSLLEGNAKKIRLL